MDIERVGHPANWLHQELFSIPDEPTSEEWWSGFNTVLQEVRSLSSDHRSVASVCFSMAIVLIDRTNTHPNDGEILNVVFQNQLIPLWEREMDKNDNWMHIAGDVWEFGSIVGNEKGRDKVRWGAKKIGESLPTHSQIQLQYPDEMIANGIEAVMVGKRNWYHHMADLYKFCDLGNDVNKILHLCEQNSWTQEAQAWNEVRDYFYNLLLNIDLTLVDPRLIENIYEYVQSESQNMDQTTFASITKRVSAWKFARSHVYGNTQNTEARLM